MQENTKIQSFWNPKRIFYVPKFTTKTICMLGLLIAITIVLSMISGRLRFGIYSKLTVSFISIFVVAYYYGGILGGTASAIADIFSYFMFGGMLIIPIVLIEFLFGFLSGILFYKTNSETYMLKTLIFSIMQLLSNILFKSYIFSISFNDIFIRIFIERIPICIIQLIVTIVAILSIKPYLKQFNKLVK